MYWFCLQYVKSKEDADEIVNDAFLSIWEKKETLKFDESLKSYLYTTVRNKSINFLRKKKIEFSFDDNMYNVSNIESSPSQIIEGKEVAKFINIFIEQLPNKCKQVFVLSRKEQMSNKEIAQLLEISPKTVENQIGIAIKIIKQKLDNTNKTKAINLNLPTFIALSLISFY